MKRFVRLIKNAELIVELAVQLYICIYMYIEVSN